ncbi:hypothetical protein EIP86_003203 [Pleurotus ostreatoroseus]|nr:hypothetical protein EIP86_003203 [Pleurotus ostreatoroseus]
MDFVEYRVEDDDDEVQEGERDAVERSIGADVSAEQGNITDPLEILHADIEGAVPSGSGAGVRNTDIGTNVSDYGIQEALRLSPTLPV